MASLPGKGLLQAIGGLVERGAEAGRIRVPKGAQVDFAEEGPPGPHRALGAGAPHGRGDQGAAGGTGL